MKKITRFIIVVLFSMIVISLNGCTATQSSKLEFRCTDGYIQWKYEDDDKWNNVVSIDNLNNGVDGKDGVDGVDGKSAYEIAKENGFLGSEQEWIDSLSGLNGDDGKDGSNGKSAYELAVMNGYHGTLAQWLQSLKGQTGAAGTNGTDGTDGTDGKDGLNGKSAYELAVMNGYRGTLTQWLQSLKGQNGADGAPGKSAYQIAQELGFGGTEEEWLESLKGEQGSNSYYPVMGDNGNWWINGVDTNIPVAERDMDRVGTDGLYFAMTIKNGVSGYEVLDYVGTETDIVIPNLVYEVPVISIRDGALPSSITSLSISSYTEFLPSFDNYSSLQMFDYNNASTTLIPDSMFENCYKLKELKNYSNIETIGEDAFYGTDFYQIDFTNIKTIGEGAFRNTVSADELIKQDKNGFIYIPDTVTSVGADSFDSDLLVYYGGSTDVTLSSSEITFDNVIHKNGYYYQNNGSDITILNYDGDEKRIEIPGDIDGVPVTSIPDFGFYANYNLERVELPTTITEIGEEAFSFCKRLHSLFIPASVQSMGDYVADNDEEDFEHTYVFFAATTFDYTGGVTSPSALYIDRFMIGVNPASICDDNNCIYYSTGFSYEVVSFKNNTGKIIVPSTIDLKPVTKINTYALYNDSSNVDTIVLPSSIKKIGTNAFYYSSSIEAIYVPTSVEIVNYHGFYNLSNCTVYIESATIPTDWDSSWYYNLGGRVLGAMKSNDNQYLYCKEDDIYYLCKYLKNITTNEIIKIPSTIDGNPISLIAEDCFKQEIYTTVSGVHEIQFIIPSSILDIDGYAFRLELTNYVEDVSFIVSFFLEVDTLPYDWSYYWYSINNTNGDEDEIIYYSSDWTYVNGIPTAK